jgi:hypothetical protein
MSMFSYHTIYDNGFRNPSYRLLPNQAYKLETLIPIKVVEISTVSAHVEFDEDFEVIRLRITTLRLAFS